MITTAAYGWSTNIVHYNRAYVTGDTIPYPHMWNMPPPPVSQVTWRPPPRMNRLVDKLLDRKWPCAVASKPGPPPVPLELAAEQVVARPRALSPGVRPQPRLRLTARQSVPPRTRRKLRVWERAKEKTR